MDRHFSSRRRISVVAIARIVSVETCFSMFTQLQGKNLIIRNVLSQCQVSRLGKGTEQIKAMSAFKLESLNQLGGGKRV